MEPFEGERSLEQPNVYVSLTYDPLDTGTAVSRVKSPKAGAVVLFAGRRTNLLLYTLSLTSYLYSILE